MFKSSSFKTLVQIQLVNVFDRNYLFLLTQHGFRRRHSKLTSLTLVVSINLEAFRNTFSIFP